MTEEHAVRMVRTYRKSPDKESSGIKGDSGRDEKKEYRLGAVPSTNKTRIGLLWIRHHQQMKGNREPKHGSREQRSSRINAGRGRIPCLKRQPRFTGEWPEDRRSHEMAIVRSDVYGMKEKCLEKKTTTDDDYPHDEEGLPRKEKDGRIRNVRILQFPEFETKDKRLARKGRIL
jgi:hypothetical protein